MHPHELGVVGERSRSIDYGGISDSVGGEYAPYSRVQALIGSSGINRGPSAGDETNLTTRLSKLPES